MAQFSLEFAERIETLEVLLEMMFLNHAILQAFLFKNTIKENGNSIYFFNTPLSRKIEPWE